MNISQQQSRKQSLIYFLRLATVKDPRWQLFQTTSTFACTGIFIIHETLYFVVVDSRSSNVFIKTMSMGKLQRELYSQTPLTSLGSWPGAPSSWCWVAETGRWKQIHRGDEQTAERFSLYAGPKTWWDIEAYVFLPDLNIRGPWVNTWLVKCAIWCFDFKFDSLAVGISWAVWLNRFLKRTYDLSFLIRSVHPNDKSKKLVSADRYL